MGKLRNPRAWTVALLLAAAALPIGAYSADLIIGTGATASVHTNVGRAICRLIHRANSSTTCEVAAIEGRDAAEPLAVLTQVRNCAIEIGVI